MPLKAKDKLTKIFAAEFFSPINRHALLAIQPVIDMPNDCIITASDQINEANKASLPFKIEKGTGMQFIYQTLSLRMLGAIYHLHSCHQHFYLHFCHSETNLCTRLKRYYLI